MWDLLLCLIQICLNVCYYIHMIGDDDVDVDDTI